MNLIQCINKAYACMYVLQAGIYLLLHHDNILFKYYDIFSEMFSLSAVMNM